MSCNWERTVVYCLSSQDVSKQPLHSPLPSPHSHFLDFQDKPSDSSRLLVRRHGSGFASNLLKIDIEVRSYNSNPRHHERQVTTLSLLFRFNWEACASTFSKLLLSLPLPFSFLTRCCLAFSIGYIAVVTH